MATSSAPRIVEADQDLVLENIADPGSHTIEIDVDIQYTWPCQDGERWLALTTETGELRQLRDALRGGLGTVKRDTIPEMDVDWRSRWPLLAELGVAGFCVPEARGGYGFEVAAAVVASQEFGGALHGSPYAGLIASVHVLAGSDVDAPTDLVDDILVGERICTLGILDSTAAEAGDDEVTGVATLVDGAGTSDALLLMAPSSPDALLVADPTAWTVDPTLPTFDASRPCGDVRLDRVRGLRCSGGAAVLPLYRLLLAGDALGGVERMLDRTVTYVRDRQAFGRPIGAFQAVQHRLVDHVVRVRAMSLGVGEAARMLRDGNPRAEREVALAELAVSSEATHVLHDLVQLTGAVGFTWEHGLHHYERRAHHDARLARNPRSAARSLAGFEGWSGGREHQR